MNDIIRCSVYGMAINYFADYADVDFDEHVPIINKEYILLLRASWNRKYELRGHTIHTMCGSGYTTATVGDYDLTSIEQPIPFGYFPKQDDLFVDIYWDEKGGSWELVEDREEHYYASNNVSQHSNCIRYSYDGGDGYYPSGQFEAIMDKFVALPRAMDKMPIYIFEGESGLGKSSLASIVKGKRVFETDAYKELPDEIWADIVVLGNKWSHTIEDIWDRIPGDLKPKVEFIEVYFEGTKIHA